MNSLGDSTARKRSGAYYTPQHVARDLVSWAIHADDDRLLDPSCGDGRFLACHRNSVGIEQDPKAAQSAIEAAPWALVHDGDFFAWAAATNERFEAAAGNPPFIRYQTFNGEVRRRALELCRSLGADFSGLSSSWAPFLVAATALLKPGGRMAFVVPAEIGHAPYAAPLLEHLVGTFARVQVVAIREKVFANLSEDCWLLYADGYGVKASEIGLTLWERYKPGARPPKPTLKVSLPEWRTLWNRRLRPLLVSPEAREAYQTLAGDKDSFRLSSAAAVGIGYVSGANDFFHLRPSQAERLGIPDALLLPTVRNGRALPARTLTRASLRAWRAADEPVLLLRLPKAPTVASTVRRYLDSAAGQAARQAYKCRVRDPWWSVPDVRVPNYFLSYMSGRRPALVRNSAGATCTNSVHGVRTLDAPRMARAARLWDAAFVQLSCELEGHPLGGGMLKVEPREAGRILIPAPAAVAQIPAGVVEDALTTLRAWRHHAD